MAVRHMICIFGQELLAACSPAGLTCQLTGLDAPLFADSNQFGCVLLGRDQLPAAGPKSATCWWAEINYLLPSPQAGCPSGFHTDT